MMSQQPDMVRVRIVFEKRDALRFIGHLDLAKTWERVLRRARVPLVYSQGFNPQPKMQLASALSLGISSECELLDIWLREPVDLAELPGRLMRVSPPGLLAVSAREVPLRSPALQTLVESSEYRITVGDLGDVPLAERVNVLLAHAEILRERRGKTYDLRPLILDLKVETETTFLAWLTTGEKRGNARPDELLDAMGLSFENARCHRTSLQVCVLED